VTRILINKLPLFAGLIGGRWMVIAIQMVAVRPIFVTNYVGFRTGMLLPTSDMRSQAGTVGF